MDTFHAVALAVLRYCDDECPTKFANERPLANKRFCYLDGCLLHPVIQRRNIYGGLTHEEKFRLIKFRRLGIFVIAGLQRKMVLAPWLSVPGGVFGAGQRDLGAGLESSCFWFFYYFLGPKNYTMFSMLHVSTALLVVNPTYTKKL